MIVLFSFGVIGSLSRSRKSLTAGQMFRVGVVKVVLPSWFLLLNACMLSQLFWEFKRLVDWQYDATTRCEPIASLS